MRDATSYRAIAPYYDWIMAHVDYDGWGRHLARLWRRFGADPASVLEIGAGTCPFSRRDTFPQGAKVVYTDLSPFMLTQVAPATAIGARSESVPLTDATLPTGACRTHAAARLSRSGRR